MKTLISLKEVEAALEHGDTILYIDADTIITPSARDAAMAAGLVFEEKNTCACSAAQGKTDNDLIYRALQILMEKGMMDFIEPRERFFITLRAGSPENELVSVIRAFALGTTQTNWIGFKSNRDSEIDGAGYVAQDTPVLRGIARESSASMIDLAEKRLDLQRQYGMADNMTLTFHERAKELAHQAETMEAPALDRRQIFRSSLSYLILNHPVIHKSITDAVWGILWYMALLVPFMFFFEKLVFGFTDIRKQLLAEAGIFLTVFILLRMLHPAFQIVRSSIMILLGFVIIFIAGSATILLSAKFKENIDALRAAKGEVQNAEGNKMGMMTTAFMLGLNNMHTKSSFSWMSIFFLSLYLAASTPLRDRFCMRAISLVV